MISEALAKFISASFFLIISGNSESRDLEIDYNDCDSAELPNYISEFSVFLAELS